MSELRPRTDDFRCHDPRLVQILPGRVDEAVETALSLASQGACDGVFVHGPELDEWEFLERVAGLDRFAFAAVHSSFATVDIGRVLSNATSLGISDIRVPLDLSRFDRLEDLGYQWHSHPVALKSRTHLRTLRLAGVGDLAQRGLELPRGLRSLWIVKLEGSSLSFSSRADRLEEVQLSFAPNVHALPDMPGNRSLELDHVGKTQFDYESISREIEALMIQAGAPIESWAFLEGRPALEHLYIERTKCVVPDAQARRRLARIESLTLPRQVAASLRDA